MDLDKLPQADPLDPEEFIFAVRLSDAAYGMKTPMRSPADRGVVFKGNAGKTYAMPDIPIHRYGLALAEHFRGHESKFRSFLLRHFAMQEMLRSKKARQWSRKCEGGREFHPAVLHVAATMPFNDGFDEKEFFRRIRELAAQMPPEP